MATVGFVGTGNIGNPIAMRLLDAGHELVVFDLRTEATRNLVAKGAKRADSCRAVAGACRLVFSSLPGPPEVEAAVRGDGGLLAGSRPGDVHVDLSTSSYEMVRSLHALEAASGVSLLDAPVSGGTFGAEQGTLTVMASGAREAFDRARSLMEAFGQHIYFLGEPGAGTLVKLINNAIFLCAGMVLQEGFVMAAKAGLDPQRLLDVVKVSSAGMYAGMAEMTLGRDFDNAFFTLALAEKDVALALDSARALRAPMPVTSAAHQIYLQALARGLGDKVFFATLQALEATADTQVPRIPG